MSAPEALIDPFGRTVRDLRISVTDRCNFRCTYCMPEEGMKWLDRSEVLSFEEIQRFARICVERFDVDGIRLTGGEPTVRAHLPVLVDKLAQLRRANGQAPDIAITTNGSTLRNVADELFAAGINRINISLDTLKRDRFLAMTRRDELDNVLSGIDAAKKAGFNPVKINAVVERGVNDDEIVDLARFGRDNGLEVRFIEFMPLDAEQGWSNSKVVSHSNRFPSAVRHPPTAGAISTCHREQPARWLGSFPPSPSPSAATVTACASPPRASSARVFSPRANSTCVHCCATAPATTTSPTKFVPPSAPSGPATRSARSPSCARRAQ
jgi:molybdenum cofactor biosynthesis protein A